MDFFARQEQARHRTGILVGLFFVSVLLITVTIYFTVAMLFPVGAQSQSTQGAPQSSHQYFDPGLFALVTGIVLLIVGSGTAYQIRRLSGGGATVAEMLGGRAVDPSTSDPNERRLLNVVEEMAIASGTPLPRVYILPDEPGINAFAAGYSTRDAVVAVTRGACIQLTRDELQGVVAHEFSHILNGDMRLNIRLMGILHGLLVMSMIGYGLFRVLGSTSQPRRRSSKDNSGAAIMALMFLGLAVMVIGYIGVFFGNLIKAAVSRQREFLADAAAVQFTRNPDGLAGALKKIGGLPDGSRLQNQRASEASHLFFSDGVRRSFAGLLATHPSLKERIRRLDPSFFVATAEALPTAPAAPAMAAAHAVSGLAQPGSVPTSQIQEQTERIGTLTPAGLANAAALLNAIPNDLRAQVRTQAGAISIIYALMLSHDPQVRARQTSALQAILNPTEHAALNNAAKQIAKIERHLRLPLAALAFQPLQLADESFRKTFRANLLALAQADQSVDMFEFLLLRAADKNLAPVARRSAIRYFRKSDVAGHARILFSAIAHADQTDQTEAVSASYQASERVFWDASKHTEPLPLAACDPSALGPALDQLRLAAPAIKKALIKAAVAGICSDQFISPMEAELMRAVADDLDCPLPPLQIAA